MAKELTTLAWIEDFLPQGFLRKSIFGGFGYYLDDLMILALFESDKDWHGVLYPVERIQHAEILKLFPELKPHSILSKWLYLPSDYENFESHAEAITKRMRQEVSKGSGLFGVIPDRKKKALAKSRPAKDPLQGIDFKKVDTRRPKMFSDEPAKVALTKAKKISDLKNLGPQAEKHFQKAGIKSVQAFVKMGWEKAFAKLAKADPKLRHTLYAYALIGALKNKNWLELSPQEKADAKALNQKLKPKKK
jgi:hypothetical protein